MIDKDFPFPMKPMILGAYPNISDWHVQLYRASIRAVWFNGRFYTQMGGNVDYVKCFDKYRNLKSNHPLDLYLILEKTGNVKTRLFNLVTEVVLNDVIVKDMPIEERMELRNEYSMFSKMEFLNINNITEIENLFVDIYKDRKYSAILLKKKRSLYHPGTVSMPYFDEWLKIPKQKYDASKGWKKTYVSGGEQSEEEDQGPGISIR